MKRVLIFLCLTLLCAGTAIAAGRDKVAQNRPIAFANNQQAPFYRGSPLKLSAKRTTESVARTPKTVQLRIPVKISKQNPSRSVSIVPRRITPSATTVRNVSASGRASQNTSQSSRSALQNQLQSRGKKTIPRAAIDTTSETITGTRTGAEYEQCKNAFFTCMDQFCTLKNDDYRRCSCSDRIYDLAATRKKMQDAGEQLTIFNENLDVVGMNAAQATAMRTASEGENALTEDTSASKALLQAIMNSIRGEDSTVGGKYTALNSIDLSFDTTNAFGIVDSGQAIAKYNGKNLYTAVYPQCRHAVSADCNDASLQRAITAYLMAIEQDCNTVQTAIEEKQKQMKSAVRESSAMLDLARVENRKQHNSDSIAACIGNVEKAILSEEVCGAGYHKCLDNGEFIDISTGKPIAGVENFYKLENLLTFASGVEPANQKLSKVSANQTFVKNFENKVKKFALPALDKCTEQADVVWEEYLDKALLDIYYAQKSKVAEIKQGCFDFVSSCYMNGDNALTDAMKELVDENSVVLQPDKIALSTNMCKNYINSCNSMFDSNIIADYIENRQDVDTLTACRAVAKQCFDNFGGPQYENFYYPFNGLFLTGEALDWFTLYEYKCPDDGCDANNPPVRTSEVPVSKCAQQLKKIKSCSSDEMLAKAFGGFDVTNAKHVLSNSSESIYYIGGSAGDTSPQTRRYGTLNETPDDSVQLYGTSTVLQNVYKLDQHRTRPTGIATELYYQIVDILSTQCANLQGRFVELQFIKIPLYDENNLCKTGEFDGSSEYGSLNDDPDSIVSLYGIGNGEDMCPKNYDLQVDTQSWGACLCWENGARRSKNGTSVKCVPEIPIVNNPSSQPIVEDGACLDPTVTPQSPLESHEGDIVWCTPLAISGKNQVCPITGSFNENGLCTYGGESLSNLPVGI